MTAKKFLPQVTTTTSAWVCLLAVALLGSGPAMAQPETELEALKQEIEALKKGQDAMQKELDEIRQSLRRPRSKPRSFQPFDLSTEGAPSRGAPDAPITIVEFTDYQCPYCARYYANTLPDLLETYVDTGKVRYVVRELPIESIHPKALKAAEAARCAGEQDKYWEMHDALFRNQTRLDPVALSAHAERLGLDMVRFSQCQEEGEQAATVRQDVRDGMRAGVRGTPTFFLGLTRPDARDTLRATEVIRGAQSFSTFKETIDALLAPKEKKVSEKTVSTK